MKLFSCDYCKKDYPIVIWRNSFSNAGYLCTDCWDKLKKRINQLFSRQLIQNKCSRNR